jgi:hypothetical protein
LVVLVVAAVKEDHGGKVCGGSGERITTAKICVGFF